MKLLHRRLAIPTLIIICAALTGSIALALHTTKATHPITPVTTVPKASPAKLAADEAAYKASTALSTQLCNTSDQARQAEQAALDQYGDTSPQYQAAETTANTAYIACADQERDAISKSLQVTIDGGTASN